MKAAARTFFGLLLSCAAVGGVLVGCGSAHKGAASGTTTGTTAAACDTRVPGAPRGGALLKDPNIQTYTANFASPTNVNLYILWFGLDLNARVAGTKVFPPTKVGFEATSMGPYADGLGSPGCSGRLVVRFFYPVPKHPGFAPPSPVVTAGGKPYFYLDYDFENLTKDKILPSLGGHAFLSLVQEPAPMTTETAAQAKALEAVLAQRPFEIFVDGSVTNGRYPLDGGTLCDARWSGANAPAPMHLIAVWDQYANSAALTDASSCARAVKPVGAKGTLDPKYPPQPAATSQD